MFNPWRTSTAASEDWTCCGKVVTVRVEVLGSLQIPYNVVREAQKRENRIANRGIPFVSTVGGYDGC